MPTINQATALKAWEARPDLQTTFYSPVSGGYTKPGATGWVQGGTIYDWINKYGISEMPEIFNPQAISTPTSVPTPTPTPSPTPTPTPTPTTGPTTLQPGELPPGAVKDPSSGKIYYPSGIAPTSTPTSTPTPVTQTGAVDQNIANIQKVFGADWKPSPAFANLQSQGIYGAVRIEGTNEVYTIGPGGKYLSADEYKNLFGTSNQQGIVGIVSKEQATALGVKPEGVSFNDMFGEGANKVAETSDSLDVNEAADEAKRKEDEANATADAAKEAEKLTYTYQTEKLKQDLAAMGIDWETGEKITKPPLPGYESTYKSLMSENGMEQISSDINDIKKKERELEESYKRGIEESEQALAPMELIGTKQQALDTQYRRKAEELRLQKQTLIDEYNTKLGMIEITMKYKEMDFATANDNYQTSFNNAIKLLDIVSGREKEAKDDVQAIKDSAKANLSVITSMMSETNKGWDELDSSMQTQITQLELKSGLPQGITKAIYEGIDTTKDESFHIVSDDQTQVSIFYKDGSVDTFSTRLPKKSTGTIVTDETTINKFYTELNGTVIDNQIKRGITREVIATQLKSQYPDIDSNDIQRAVYDAYPDSYVNRYNQ